MEITGSNALGVTDLLTNVGGTILKFDANGEYYTRSASDSLMPLKYTDSAFFSQSDTDIGYFSDHITLTGNQEIQILLQNFAHEPSFGPGVQGSYFIWYSGIYQTANNATSGLITHTTFGLLMAAVRQRANFNTTIQSNYFNHYATNTTSFPTTSVRIASVGTSGDRQPALMLRSFSYGSTAATAITKYSFYGHCIQHY